MARDGIHILIVEDNPADAKLMRRWLERATGVLSLQVAERGDLAVAELRRASADGRAFDLVLLDANLPDMTGWEVIEAARRSAVSPTSQFLMLSGTCCDEDVQQAQSLGLVGFELKPFDAEEFGRLVDRISAFAAQSVRS